MAIGDIGRGLTYALVAVASLAYLGGALLDQARSHVTPGATYLPYVSSATVEAVHVVATNMSAGRAYACFRGTVTNKTTKATTLSHVVCTGILGPRSTVSLDAPFPVGDVRDLCSGKDGGLEWARCTLVVADVTPL